MFHGCVVKPGSKTSLPSDCGAMFHLSQACLGGDEGTKSVLQVSDGKGTYNLCALRTESPHAPFDLFLPAQDTDIYLTVKGNSEIHVTGYFEPDPEPDFDMEGSDFEGEQSELEEDNDAQNDLLQKVKTMPGKKLTSLLPSSAEKKGQKLAAIMKGKSKMGEDESSDEELNMKAVANALGQASDDDDEDDDDEDDEDDEDDDDDDGEIDEKAILEAIEKARKGNSASALLEKARQLKTDIPGQKRKPEAATPAPKKKVAKKETPATPSTASTTVENDDDAKYQKSLMEYLKAHGKSPISQLGSTVKKPPSVKKLGAFIRERPSAFKIEGSFVKLK